MANNDKVSGLVDGYFFHRSKQLTSSVYRNGEPRETWRNCGNILMQSTSSGLTKSSIWEESIKFWGKSGRKTDGADGWNRCRWAASLPQRLQNVLKVSEQQPLGSNLFCWRDSELSWKVREQALFAIIEPVSLSFTALTIISSCQERKSEATLSWQTF